MSTTRDMIRKRQAAVATPKRGEALFDGTDYPRTWSDYVGQAEAKAFLRASAVTAKARGKRMDHVLIASGQAGIGKSALARLIAQEMDAGLVEVQGVVEVSDAVRILNGMQDGDILFWDEIHNAVAGGKAKAEWLLPFLQDGVIVTSQGVTAVPSITVIAASTDAQKLPEAILSRFTVKPVLESYTAEEAGKIFDLNARRIFSEVGLHSPGEWNREAIVEAANRNPRQITQLARVLLTSVIGSGQDWDGVSDFPMDDMFTWSGLTPDGLDRVAQDYLMQLFYAPNFTAGEKTIAQALNEATPPRHTEKLLIQKGLVQVCARGRQLTSDGVVRANELLNEMEEA